MTLDEAPEVLAMLLEQKDTRPGHRDRVLAAKDVHDPGSVCTCTVEALPSPAGEVMLLAVAGEIDLCSVSSLQVALTGVLAGRPDHLVVDLAGVTFCSVCGLTALTEAGAVAAGQGTGFAVSGASRHLDRVWALLWPEGERPMRFPTAGTAVLSAMAHQVALRDLARRVGTGPSETSPAKREPIVAIDRGCDRMEPVSSLAGS